MCGQQIKNARHCCSINQSLLLIVVIEISLTKLGQLHKVSAPCELNPKPLTRETSANHYRPARESHETNNKSYVLCKYYAVQLNLYLKCPIPYNNVRFNLQVCGFRLRIQSQYGILSLIFLEDESLISEFQPIPWTWAI